MLFKCAQNFYLLCLKIYLYVVHYQSDYAVDREQADFIVAFGRDTQFSLIEARKCEVAHRYILKKTF